MKHRGVWQLIWLMAIHITLGAKGLGRLRFPAQRKAFLLPATVVPQQVEQQQQQQQQSQPSPVVPGVQWLCTDASGDGDDCDAVAMTLGSVERPKNDAKAYRVLELPNGLRALLVSDPSSEMAGCSMNIHAGSFQDPPDFAGLAHFHEHMVFLGTEKYPGEDEYEQFLSTHGGFSNAYTADEDTNFYFEVTAPHLSGAMDRFAQFFLSPTFAKEMVDREVRAIDSEHNNNVPEDAWRLHQVFKQSLREEHPISGFSTGNLETLLEQPGRTVDDLHAALVGFREKWYVTDRMTLTLQGTESLDDLEKMLVATGFGDIRSSDSSDSLDSSDSSDSALTLKAPPSRVRRDVPRFEYGNGSPFEKRGGENEEAAAAAAAATVAAAEAAEAEEEGGVVGRVRYVVPVAARRELSVVFPLGGAADKDAKPHRYLSHVLGHEGAGSLHALLQAKGWAEELSAGAGLQYDDCSAFRVSLVLTEAGEKNLFGSGGRLGVLDYLFLQLARTRADEPSAAVCEELASMAALEFAYQDEMAVSSFVSRAAGCLYDYEPTSVLSGPMLMNFVDGEQEEEQQQQQQQQKEQEEGTREEALTGGQATIEKVRAMAQRLVPENAIVTIVSKSVEEEYEVDTRGGGEGGAGEDGASVNEDSSKASRWRKEQWYGVTFREETMTKETVARWRFDSEDEGTASIVLHGTPPLNRFMPSPAEFASGVASLGGATAKKRQADEAADDAAAADNECAASAEGKPVVTLATSTATSEEEDEGGNEEERTRAWHLRPSERFRNVPKTHVLVHGATPAAYASPASTMLCRLFVRTVLSDLNTYAYDASVAGMGYELEAVTSGVVVGVTGFESQVPRLLEVILQRTAGLVDRIRARDAGGDEKDNGEEEEEELQLLEQRFETQRELLLQDFRNAEKDSPYSQASYWARQALESNVWHIDEYIDVLADPAQCNLRAMADAAANLLDADRMRLEVLVTGNNNNNSNNSDDDDASEAAAAAQAQAIADLCRRSLPAAVAATKEEEEDECFLKPPCAVQLPLEAPHANGGTGGVLIKRVVPDATNENSCVDVHLQCGLESSPDTSLPSGAASSSSSSPSSSSSSPSSSSLRRLSVQEHAALDLLAHLAYPSAFDTLRTKEQLGYLVSAHGSRFAGVMGLSVVVQSSSAGPAFLQERVDAWLASFGEELRDMPDDEVAANAGALAAMMLEKSRSMGEEHDRHAGEVLGMRYDFQRRARRAAEIAAVAKADLLAAYDRHIAPGAPERRPLRLHFYSRSHHEQEEAATTAKKEGEAPAGGADKATPPPPAGGESAVLTSLGDLRSFKEPLPRFPSTSKPWWRSRE